MRQPAAQAVVSREWQVNQVFGCGILRQQPLPSGQNAVYAETHKFVWFTRALGPTKDI